jgi:hypothetical protein
MTESQTPQHGPAPQYSAPAPQTPPNALVAGQAPTPVAQQAPGFQATTIRKQGAWGLWWLVVITAGIYYYVWYARINRELAAVQRTQVPSDGRWWSQLIPIYGLIGLARTAKRLNAAHAAFGSPTRVGVFTTWFWAALWFSSHTRYLQRRINILHDVLAARATW